MPAVLSPKAPLPEPASTLTTSLPKAETTALPVKLARVVVSYVRSTAETPPMARFAAVIEALGAVGWTML